MSDNMEIMKIVELVRALPNPDLDFWKNTLRVDVEIIENAINNVDTGQFQFRLKRLFDITHMSSIVWTLLDLKEEYKTKAQITEEILKYHVKNKYIFVLFLCNEYMYGKDKFSKSKVAEECLGEKLNSFGKCLKIDIYQCILIFSIDEKNLVYYVLLDRYEQAAFKQYILTSGDDDANRDNVIKKLEKGINFEDWIINTNIDEVLKRYEDRENTEKSSKKLGILSRKNYFILFIQRTEKRRNVREQELTVWGLDTNIIILKFNKNGQILTENTMQKDGKDIAGYLCSNAYKSNLIFIPDAPGNSTKKFRRFLDNILDGNDELIEIKEIEYENFGVIGSPTVIMVKESKVNLSESLDDFRVKGFDLLKDLNNLSVLKLNFKKNTGDNVNIVTLNPFVSNDQIILPYLNSKLSSDKTEFFMLYMEREYGLKVRPNSKQNT